MQSHWMAARFVWYIVLSSRLMNIVQAVAMAASHCVLVRDRKARGNGGAVHNDGLVMNLTPVKFNEVLDSIRRFGNTPLSLSPV